MHARTRFFESARALQDAIFTTCCLRPRFVSLFEPTTVSSLEWVPLNLDEIGTLLANSVRQTDYALSNLSLNINGHVGACRSTKKQKSF